MLLVGIYIFAASDDIFAAAVPVLMGLVFAATGGGILVAQIKKSKERKKIAAEGTRFIGKIHSYIEDKSCTMNGDYLVNIKVHYYDKAGIEREAIIPTGFTKGSGDYPIGATIDIIALGTRYSWDKDSVRYERIFGEDDLMDDKPINAGNLDMTAVTCSKCGASFTATKGYVSKCPYCGSSTNC